MQEKKYSEQTWFIVLALIFFFPVGLYLMWKHKKFSPQIRKRVTFFFIILTVIVALTDDNKTTSVNTSSKSAKKSSQETKQKTSVDRLNFTGEMQLKVSGNKVIATITSNVPDGGLFEVSIVNGKFDTFSGFYPIKNGKIVKEFVIPKKWGVGYISGLTSFRFNLSKKPQPAHIKKLYGNKGEKMTGEQAQTNNLGGKNGTIEVVTIAYPSEQKVKAAVNKVFNTALKELIKASGGVIKRIEPSSGSGGWSMVRVYVSDSWYYSETYEKERFAEQCAALIEKLVKDSGKVSEDGTVGVFFYDTYGKRLASPKMFGGYEVE